MGEDIEDEGVLECLKDRAFDSTDCLYSFVIMLLPRSVVEC